MSAHAVVIAGGGPTGLVLAGELALAGVDVAVVERRADRALEGSRAGGLHARTIEVLDQRGIAGPFLEEGQQAQTAGFAGVTIDLAGFPTRHPYGIGLWQNRIEAHLADWVDRLPVTFHRGREVVGLEQDATGVDVLLSDGGTLRADWLVGCDGGRSAVRKAAGFAFPGSAATTSNLIGEVEMDDEPELGVHRGPFGIYAFGKEDYEIVDGEVVYAEGGPVRVMLTEEHVGAGEPTFEDLRAAVVATTGSDHGMRDPVWISRFTDAARQVERYRDRRVLLAGDAAHVHPPDGGFGLQTGVQDAVNLGWKLARVVDGTAPEGLLDSYHAERHPVGATVLRHAMASTVLRRPDERTTALRETVAGLLGTEEARNALAAEMTGLGIRYDLGDGHPLLGRRVPDLDLVTADGPVRVFEFLHEARPVLLDLGASALDPVGCGTEAPVRGGTEGPGDAPSTVDPGPWADRVRTVRARCDGPWELPAIGAVEAPPALLVRPDGYVAWVGDGDGAGLAAAMGRWFGPAG
ncbi:FAD-dependent monooxygenase [Patulibacter minatonensis]|uniref:FAD-dependent monooxygenase n=1 Tax=Patulibacter minatonensis TaxID=298163 RepID=UPI00047A1ECC|nr:FAD-dependent monooxygenase [Patulibacter minatonensis]